MKIISGDFVAVYNNIMKVYCEQQEKLDNEFTEKIDKIVNDETDRLEKVVPLPFAIGDKVKTTDGKIGIVESCPVTLHVKDSEQYDTPQYGPSKYLKIQTEVDEEILTCEGMVRTVYVKFQTNQLSMDWGVNFDYKRYWPDELVLCN
jgi:hypothetical protein